MRYLPHLLVGTGVIAAAGIAWYAFSGPSKPAAAERFCRVVAFKEAAKSGSGNVCLRCVAGPYTARSWANCETRPSEDHEGWVDCGFNPGQTPTPIDPAAMCARENPEPGTAPALPPGGPPPMTMSSEASGPTPIGPAVSEGGTAPPYPSTGGTAPPIRTAPPPGTANEGVVTGQVSPRGPTSPNGTRHPGVSNAQEDSDLGQVVDYFSQDEQRDASGRITREAAQVRVVSCSRSGRIRYIYEYQSRHAFRAIIPPFWSEPLGGHDFVTFGEALQAACR